MRKFNTVWAIFISVVGILGTAGGINKCLNGDPWGIAPIILGMIGTTCGGIMLYAKLADR